MSANTFLEQVRQNQGIVYKLVALYARDAEEKKDLYQEVLLQAWKAWSNYRGDAKFSTWLYRICLNTILTQRRRAQKIDFVESLEPLAPVIRNGTEEKEDATRVQQAIRRLSETDRAIISMHLDGYDNTEVSDLIGISVNHVAVKLHRIKQQLANFLMQYA